MEILFLDPTGPEAKVSQSNIVNFYPSISRDMSWANIRPFIEASTREMLVPILSKELYDKMVIEAKASEPNAAKKNIIEYFQTAIAYYTVFNALPHLNGVISNAGVNHNISEKTDKISQWSFKQIRWSALLMATKMVQLGLELIQESTDTWYDPFKTSSEHMRATSDWIVNAKDFSTLIQKATDYNLFLALVPQIREQEDHVKEVIGQRSYDYLLPKKTSGTTIEKEAIKLIRIYIAAKAMSLSMPALQLYIDGNGVYKMTSTDGIEPGYGVFSSANETAITVLTQHYDTMAAKKLQDLVNHFNKNADTFTLYKEDRYVEYNTKTMQYSVDCHGNPVGGVIL